MMLFQILLCLMVVTCVQGQTPVLLMQGRESSTAFRYTASYWTSANTYRTQYSSPRTGQDAKLAAFNTMPLYKVKLCMGNSLPGTCYEYPVPNAPKTALALFNGPHIRTTDLDQNTWNSMMRNTNRRNCGMQRPGFNTRCNDGNWARWGYCDNIPSQGCQTADGNDADRAIGLGLAGQSSSYASAGVQGYPGRNRYGPSRQFWLYGIGPPVSAALIALEANVTSLASSLAVANARLAQVDGLATGAVNSISQLDTRLGAQVNAVAAGAASSLVVANARLDGLDTLAAGAVTSISQLDTRLDAVAGKLAAVAARAVSDISLERPNTTNVNTTDVGVQDPQISTDNGDVVIELSPGKALRLGGIADVEHDLNVAMARIDRLEQLLANAL
jgi:hypothetical protein